MLITLKYCVTCKSLHSILCDLLHEHVREICLNLHKICIKFVLTNGKDMFNCIYAYNKILYWYRDMKIFVNVIEYSTR